VPGGTTRNQNPTKARIPVYKELAPAPSAVAPVAIVLKLS